MSIPSSFDQKAKYTYETGIKVSPLKDFALCSRYLLTVRSWSLEAVEKSNP